MGFVRQRDIRKQIKLIETLERAEDFAEIDYSCFTPDIDETEDDACSRKADLFSDLKDAERDLEEANITLTKMKKENKEYEALFSK